MTDKELIANLRRLKVETGSLVCLGCGYEHNCGIHGCAILRKTIAWLERKLAEDKSRSVMEYRDGHLGEPTAGAADAGGCGRRF